MILHYENNIKVGSERLGHSTIGITAHTYSCFANMQKEAAQLLEQLKKFLSI
ncbi:hypothetical protein [Neobacillus cucumis]|uniref:hypothetical protein n=1 Tax=Neobacillus cucumis TaxID=1740721 RepID=UPI00285334DC|nr:hypothetical protein [Neobacillus cucumis]MDR4950412.1 hypothetical protein [Neobacillus cucumis]